MAGGSYVGLDIGSNLIKVAEVKRSGNKLEVVALGLAPTPMEAFENSVIVDAQMLGQAVKTLLRQAGIGTRQCVSSVSGQSAVVVRVIEVPQMNPAELAETMKWEVERHVPFATSEVIMDYQPIMRPEGYAEGQNMEVLLAVAQQDMIDRHVEMLFAAGLKPVAIDVEPLAAGRAMLELGQNGHPEGYTVAIVNIGASNTDMAIFRDKLLVFPRTLPMGGDNLTRAIAEAFHDDMAAAEKLKRDLGEVMLDQVAQQAPDFGGGASPGFTDFSAQTPTGPSPSIGGFTDFSTPQQPGLAGPSAPGPTAPGPVSSPSGRMPFDFSTPGEEPAPAPAPFGFTNNPPSNPAPAPFDLTGGLPSGEAAPTAPQTEAGFFQPVTSGPDPNLPVLASDSGGDPGRDIMKRQVFAAMGPVLAELAQELRRSLDFYRGRAADAQIHQVLLVGGTAKLKNLAQFLEMEMGIPTRVADPMQVIPITSKNFSQTHLEEIASLFPVSIGLGARDLIAVPGGKAAKKR